MKKILFCLFLLSSAISTAFAQQFEVSYVSTDSGQPFTGYVVLYLSKDSKAPTSGMVGFSKTAYFSVYVKNIKPGGTVKINDEANSYPAVLTEIQRGPYYVEVIWDKNLGGRAIAESPGNIYSEPLKINIEKNTKQVYHLVADKVIPAPEFKETAVVKELKVPSALLTKSQGRPVTVDAAVILPKEYASEPNRKFPVLFKVSGYGGDYHRYSGSETPGAPIDTIPVITVFLDGNCAGGHSVYANSDNNGPWGDALTTEFIPALEKQFRCNGAKLLTGHSSGGWTVAWLQTHYPKVFDGTWSSSPDPVDFRSFQTIDLYSEKNIFYGKDSVLRVAGTIAGRFPWIAMKNMYDMEHVIWRGEQMHSFNFVFGARNNDGTPRSLIDDATGVIDPVSVERWKNYDISLYVRTNWQQLKTNLQGKIRVSVGEQDNFLLNYPVHLLDDEAKKLDAGFVFGYYPGDHFTVSTPEYKTAGYRFLQQKYNESGIKN